eukprot:6624183-Pyramimonas_sp.AAC.2
MYNTSYNTYNTSYNTLYTLYTTYNTSYICITRRIIRAFLPPNVILADLAHRRAGGSPEGGLPSPQRGGGAAGGGRARLQPRVQRGGAGGRPAVAGRGVGVRKFESPARPGRLRQPVRDPGDPGTGNPGAARALRRPLRAGTAAGGIQAVGVNE